MKRSVQLKWLLFILLLLNCTNLAQINLDVKKYICNPLVFGENKEAPTAILIPFNSVKTALMNNRENSSYYKSLNGEWKFKWQINPFIVPKDFYSAKYDDSGWNNIKVPSVWQMQGYDHIMYRNVPMEFQPYDPPNVPDDINPTGCYRRNFEIPENWNEREIYIHFDGIQSSAFVWVNGQYLGYHEDGMTPAEFAITKFVKTGSNSVAVMVMRWCDGSYLEDQDMFRYSGIYRNVFVYSKPAMMIRDLFVKTDLDEKYIDANLLLDLMIKNKTAQQAKIKIRYSLFDNNDKLVLSETTNSQTLNDSLNSTITQKVISPKKWSDEKPNLYKLVVELLSEKEEVIEIINQRVGFRKLEVKNGLALLNGMQVYFRGTNRHEHNPLNGKTLTRELMIEDIKLMKQFNVNAVRTSHYPNNPEWYDLCDEFGIFLQDEINAECHYSEYSFPDRAEYTPAFLDRFTRMVERDKNHPSVVMWSTGNECGLGKPHYLMAEYIKKFDPGRFLMHQSNYPDGEAPYVDIIGPRYPPPARLREIGLTATKPVVMGEYAHAMGNSVGHFDEYWEMIYNIPKLQGGFVWDWIDEGLDVKARFTKDYSPNKFQCSVMGRPEVVKGVEGSAFKFSGLDDWIEVYDDQKLDVTKNKLTLEATIQPQKFYIENPVVIKAFQYGVIQTTKDTLSFYINSYSNSVNVKLPDDWYSKWHNIKAEYDGKEMSLFIDGKLYGMKKYSEDIHSSHYPVNIGRDSYKDMDQHLGWISNFICDEVKIYDNVSNENKIAEPLLWIKCNEITEGNNYYTFDISPFCINGMVTSDRKPQPELWQIKHSQSPVRFYSDDPCSGKFRIVNKYLFTNINEFDLEWKLIKNGFTEKSGVIELDVPPQSQKTFSVPLPEFYETENDYVFELSCKLKNDEPLRGKGFEVNFQQFILNKANTFKSLSNKIENQTKLIIKEDEKSYTVSNALNTITLSKTTGELNLYREGRQLVKAMNANVWRAPISNEKFDWGKAEAEDWYKMGLNDSKISVENFEYKLSPDSTSVNIKIKSNITLARSADYFINEFNYLINSDAAIEIKHKITPLGNFFVDWLPCLGLQFQTPDEYKNVSWYGRGPYENYSDRNTGSRLGIHKVQIADVMNPYIEPQEYGNYSEVKWFNVLNNEGKGINIEAKSDFNFSAVPFYNLDRARYTYQLLSNGNSIINLSYGINGVGDTPNPVLPEYRVYPRVYMNDIIIKPIK